MNNTGTGKEPAELQKEIARLKKEIEYYKRSYYEAVDEQEVLRKDIDELQQRYDSIVNATCWKITKPIRVVLDLVKRILKGPDCRYLFAKGINSIRQNGVRMTLKKVKAFLRSSQEQGTVKPTITVNNFHEIVHAFEEKMKNDGNRIILPEILANYDSLDGKNIILLVTHEAGLTGAPIALYRLAQNLKQQGKYPVVLTPEDGLLIKEYEREQIPVILYKDAFQTDFVYNCRNLFEIIFVNTIVPCSLIKQLNETDTQVVWWIHEAYASYDSNYKKILPWELADNIHVYTAGPYAKSVLLQHRNRYNAGELLYAVPDFFENSESFDFGEYANGKMVFASVGTLAERKGQDILVEAIKMLEPEVRKKCLFVFAGKKFSTRIEKAVQEAVKLYPENVVYLGEMSQQQMHAMYCSIDCLICSSTDDPMPIVVTEAFCASKLVICSENTGSAAVIQEMNAGYVYPDNNPSGLAEKIRFVVRDMVNLDSVRINARAAYEKYFSEAVFENRVNEIINDIVNEIRVEKRVSVVIPAYNGGEQFKRLLDILQQQKNLDFLEIVVVDSGSRDDTVEFCKQKGVILIQIPNEEFSHSYARNLGAEKASGDILLFMTQDAMPPSDVWVADMIAPIVKERITAVSCREQCPAETELYYKVSSEIHAEFMGFSSKDKIGSIQNCHDDLTLRQNANLNDVACAVRKKVFRKFQYRYDFAEDLDLGVRLLKKGYSLKFLANVFVIHGHNRTAEYYMKRSLVETASLDMILNRNENHKLMHEQDFLYLILAYGTTKYAVETMRKQQNAESSAELFFEKLDKAFEEAFSRKAEYYINSCKTQSVRNKVDELVVMLAENAVPEKEKMAYGAAQHLRYYAAQHLKPYIMKIERVVTAELEEKIYDALEKQLATFIGSEISRLQPDSRMNSFIAELKKGV